jgi:LAO/AO transport system kinase
MLDLTEFAEGEWRPTIVPTVATSGEGVEELWSAVAAHRLHLETAGELDKRRSARLRDELREIIERRLEERARELCQGDRWDALEREVANSSIDPWSAADEMLKGVGA